MDGKTYTVEIPKNEADKLEEVARIRLLKPEQYIAMLIIVGNIDYARDKEAEELIHQAWTQVFDGGNLTAAMTEEIINGQSHDSN